MDDLDERDGARFGAARDPLPDFDDPMPVLDLAEDDLADADLPEDRDLAPVDLPPEREAAFAFRRGARVAAALERDRLAGALPSVSFSRAEPIMRVTPAATTAPRIAFPIRTIVFPLASCRAFRAGGCHDQRGPEALVPAALCNARHGTRADAMR